MNLSSYIDHTILKPTTLIADIEKLCAEARKYQFAAVCVPPNFVKKAKELTNGSNVKVATMTGCISPTRSTTSCPSSAAKKK
jgi:deoxyribose-phosphate aldolase